MAWGNQGRNHYVYGAGDWSKYYWSTTYNPNATFSECMANCTTYAYGRVRENGLPRPVTAIRMANRWHEVVNTDGDWTYYNYYAGMMLYPGDILEWNAVHVAVVETQGTNPWVSASWYTGDHKKAEYPDGSGEYDTRSTAVMGSTLQSVSDWMVANVPNRFYHYNTMVEENALVDNGYDPKYVLRYEGGTPPTPPPTPTTVTPTISIQPSSYNVTMNADEDYVDFTFTVTITGVPYGVTVSGGNTYPDLTRVRNTGWSYTTYYVDGVAYQQAFKQQTLRYDREAVTAYTTTKHMYYDFTFSNGSIHSDTPMTISVLARTYDNLNIPIIWKLLKKKRKQGIKKYERL